jgi:hypothetical protein
MAGLAQVDWQSLANEANVRALLEDLVTYYKGVYGGQQLALAVWFHKSPHESEHNLLALFTGPELGRIAISERQSLLWKTGVNQPPFANIHGAMVGDFVRLMQSAPESLNQYREKSEAIYFDSRLLPPRVLQFFGIVTKPPGLVEVWCVYHNEYEKGMSVQTLLASRRGRPESGIVKTEESKDFETCKAIFHVEVGQQWRPASPEATMQSSGFYSDWLSGRPCYLLEETGVLYQIVKFEVIYAPEYASRVIERRLDDRYLEVYLRTVHLPEEPAA